jgi:hypothetical protein
MQGITHLQAFTAAIFMQGYPAGMCYKRGIHQGVKGVVKILAASLFCGAQ